MKKGRVENLTNRFDKIDPERAREIRAKGGRASGPARRLRNEMKRKLQMLLDLPASEKSKASLLSLGIDTENEMDNMMLVVASLFKEAMRGNIRAIEHITVGLERDDAVIRKLESEVLKYKREAELLKAQQEALTADKHDELSKLDILLKSIGELANEADE